MSLYPIQLFIIITIIIIIFFLFCIYLLFHAISIFSIFEQKPFLPSSAFYLQPSFHELPFVRSIFQ